MKKIAVLGSAFNPPHKGHADVIQQALDNFDLVILVPAAAHAFGKKMTPFAIRQEMVQAFAAEFFPEYKDRIIVSDIEQRLLSKSKGAKPIYTYDVLSGLESDFGEDLGAANLTFVLGPDNAEPETWERFHRSEEIKERWGLFVAKENVQIRSSVIRKSIEDNIGSQNYKDLINWSGKRVAKIIAREMLYRKAGVPIDPEQFKDPLPCQCQSTDLVCESDPCHYDSWDVVCKHCGAKTSQYATRGQAISAWNAPYIIEAILAWKNSIDVFSAIDGEDVKGCLGENLGSLGYLYAAVEAISMQPCEQRRFLQNRTEATSRERKQ